MMEFAGRKRQTVVGVVGGHEGTMASDLVLVLYSRPGCHLCEVAKEALEPILRHYGVRLEERNVENDPAWERDYGHQVPVGMIGDRKLFKYRIDPRRLELAIQTRLGVGSCFARS